MKDFVYIVFANSGCIISKMLKENKFNNRVVHFFEGGDLYDKTYADDIINLHENIEYSLASERIHYNSFIFADDVQEKIIETIKGIKNAIIIHDYIEPDYSLTLDISKKLIKNGVHCINIFCKPFKFMGQKNIEQYDNFFAEITTLKNDNYYFDCDDISNYLKTKTGFFEGITIAYMVQFYISINPEMTLNDIMEQII